MNGSGPVQDSNEREEEIGRLYDTVRRNLAFGNLEEAKAASDRLLELAPDSTSAHELHGDVLLAYGKRQEALAAFKRALEIEEGNVDAERKYAELTLALTSEAQQSTDPADIEAARLRGAPSKEPAMAAARSLMFPGLGQLYNGEYEKGVAFAIIALVLLLPAVNGIVNMLFSAHGTPAAAWQAWLGWISLVLLLILWAAGVYDAWHVCKLQDEQNTTSRQPGPPLT